MITKRLKMPVADEIISAIVAAHTEKLIDFDIELNHDDLAHFLVITYLDEEFANIVKLRYGI